MILGWFSDDLGMILGCFWDDFGMILEWYWEDLFFLNELIPKFCSSFLLVCVSEILFFKLINSKKWGGVLTTSPGCKEQPKDVKHSSIWEFSHPDPPPYSSKHLAIWSPRVPIWSQTDPIRGLEDCHCIPNWWFQDISRQKTNTLNTAN